MKKQGNIYLIGFMGVGKTTVSKYLRELTGWEEVDTDKVIVRKKNMGIPEIFDNKSNSKVVSLISFSFSPKTTRLSVSIL